MSGIVGIILTALDVLISVPIVLAMLGASRVHDPARALASMEVDAEGRFELAVLSPAGAAYLRFEIRGADTDGDYDLLVVGAVSTEGAGRAASQAAAFTRKTLASSTLEGAERAERVSSVYAITLVMGSIELASSTT